MSSGDETKLGRHAGALVSLLRSAAGSSLSLVRTSRAASVCLAKGKTFKKRLTTAMFFRNLRNIRKDHGINIIAYFFSKIRRTSFFNKEHKKSVFHWLQCQSQIMGGSILGPALTDMFLYANTNSQIWSHCINAIAYLWYCRHASDGDAFFSPY